MKVVSLQLSLLYHSNLVVCFSVFEIPTRSKCCIIHLLANKSLKDIIQLTTYSSHCF